MKEELVDVSGLAEAMTSMPAVQAEDSEPIAPASAVDDSSSEGEEDYGFGEEEQPRVKSRNKKPVMDMHGLENLKDELDVAMGDANARSSEMSKEFEKFVVMVDWPEDNKVCVTVGGKMVFVSVVRGDFSTIMRKVKGVMKRAIDACKPSVQMPEEVAEIVEAPHAEKTAKTIFKKKQEFDHVGLEEFKPMVETLLERFNTDLARYHGARRPISGLVFTSVYEGNMVSIMSGDREICRGNVGGRELAGLYKKIRAIVRSEFESTKSERSNRKPTVNSSEDFWHAVESLIKDANSRLEGSSDQLVLIKDSVGAYIRSGEIPVCSIPRPRGKDRAAKTLDMVKSCVNDFVDDMKAVIGRRDANNKLAEELSESCEGDEEAFDALKSKCGEEVARRKLQMCDAHARAAIVEAATEAVNKVNGILDLRFSGEVADILGGLDEMKLRIRGFTRGLVVSHGTDETGNWKACLVTRFPAVANNNTVEETVEYIRNAIGGIGDLRMKIFDRAKKAFDASKRLKAIAGEFDALNAELDAMAM